MATSSQYHFLPRGDGFPKRFALVATLERVSDVEFCMGGAEDEPLEDVEGSPGEGPVDEGLQLEHKGDGHEAFKGHVVHDVVAVH